MIKCWHEKARGQYLITPAWWDEKANERSFPDRELILCKTPALTIDIRALMQRMEKERCLMWMDAEFYFEQTEARMKKENEVMKKYLKKQTQHKKDIERVIMDDINLPARYKK